MTDVNELFESAPLKRSYLVRGPPGRTFQAFDRLYEEQGRQQRNQTFTPAGTQGASLAAEMARIQADAALPNSAKTALNLETARTFQLLNGFEAYVPKTHQAFIQPGDGTTQPNSWTLRGSSLPDDPATNPSAWSVTNTLAVPSRATSSRGIIQLDSTGGNTAYYAQTAANAPWDMSGTRAINLRFRLLEHDVINGANGALQIALGNGTKTWTCQISLSQLRISGTVYNLPPASFPSGLENGQFHTLRATVPNGSNDITITLDGTAIATAPSQTGTLNGIAFGDPGTNIAGKVEIETLGFDNVDLGYTYGIYGADDYADSDEIGKINNLLLYIRSKGQAFRTSGIAKWVKILDHRVYEYLLEKYTGKRDDGAQQELNIFTKNDVWLGSIVDLDIEEEVEGIIFRKTTKATNTINIDEEETKVFSTDQTRNDMQLAGILMAWTYEQDEYKEWLAEVEGGGTGIDGILIEKKHLVENIAKCADRVEKTIEIGGEIAISMTNEYVDYAITLNSMRQGDYMAMVGFIPFVPSSAARAFKFFKKADGEAIEAIYQLSTKLDDFPGGTIAHIDEHGITRHLELDKVFADAADTEAVSRAKNFTGDAPVSTYGPGATSGKEVLSTFAEGSCTIFKTKEPLKLYRVYKDGGRLPSNFLMFEKPQGLKQVVADQALMNPTTNLPFQEYNRFVEVEIPEGHYVALGYTAKMTNAAPGGGTQIWIDDATIDAIDWQAAEATATVLPP